MSESSLSHRHSQRSSQAQHSSEESLTHSSQAVRPATVPESDEAAAESTAEVPQGAERSSKVTFGGSSDLADSVGVGAGVGIMGQEQDIEGGGRI